MQQQNPLSLKYNIYDFNAKISNAVCEGATTMAGNKTREKWFKDGLARTTHVFNSAMLGMYLGDSYGHRLKSGNIALYIRHGGDQLDLVDEKVKFLSPYIKPKSLRTCVDNNGYKYRYAYYNERKLKHLFNLIYGKGEPIKRINRKLLNRFTDVSLAFLYMDDGHLSLRRKKETNKIQGRYIYLNTQGFTVEENQMFAVMLKQKFDLSFKVSFDHEHARLWCNTQNALKFISIVKPIVSFFPTMQYKLDLKYQQQISETHNNESMIQSELHGNV